MDNELNQVQETVEEDLFSEEETAEESIFGEEVVEEKEEPFLSVKYNKEEKALTKEDAINFAQKGMNYDKVNERLTSLTTRLDKLAKANGKDVDAYLEALDQMQNSLALENEMDSLKEAYPNTDEALLKEIAQGRVNAKVQETISKQNEAQNSYNNAIKKQVDEFQKQFPDVDARKLDDRVYEMMDEGKSLLEAFLLVEHQKMSQVSSVREKVDSQNEANRKKSLGNIGNVSSDTDDEFSKGFGKYF